MVSQYVWIGIIAGVFFAGIGYTALQSLCFAHSIFRLIHHLLICIVKPSYNAITLLPCSADSNLYILSTFESSNISASCVIMINCIGFPMFEISDS